MKRIIQYLSVLTLAFFALFSFINIQKKAAFFPRLGSPPAAESVLRDRLKKSEEALSRNPDDLAALVDRGVIFFELGPGHYADSLNALNAAWRDGAFDRRVFYYSGILYENLSLFEEAHRQYERFLRHEPNDREIQLRLARLLFRMGKWGDSIEAYKKLVQKNPKDVTSLVNLGLAHQKQHELKSREKRKKISAAGKKNPPPDDEILQDLKQAIFCLESAAALEPDLPEGIGLTLARLYDESGNWDKAISACQTELKNNPDDRETLQVLARSYEKLNRKDKALETLQRQLEKDPQNRPLKQKIKNLKAQLARK